MIINPYRFGVAGGVTLPTHWWDLDDDGTWADQGELAASGWDLTESGTVTTTSSTIGSGGSRTVVDFDDTEYLEFNNAGTRTVSWDGSGNDFSASCWINYDSLGSTGGWFLSWRGNSSDILWQLFAWQNGDNADTYVFDNGGASTFVNAESDVADALSSGTWYHICTTFDSSTGTVKLYIDGTEAASGTNASVDNLGTGAAPFTIGTASFNLGASSTDFNGKMHASGIWDVTLSADDVTTLYNNGDGGSYSDIFT